MDAALFWRGLIIGFSIAAPVGPIGVLCIRRTLAEGRLAGFLSGLGAATADAIYGSMAAFGLTAVAGFLTRQQRLLRLVGGAFLIYLGVRTCLTPAAERPAQAGGRGLAGNYFSTFVLTLTNPMTILSFAAIFAGLGVAVAGSWGAAAWMVAGVFAGSALWWLTLAGLVGLLRGQFTARWMTWINRLSGVVLIGFGVWILSGALLHDA